ncbi:polysaccharide deacetylase family protein [Methylobacterium sp. R2-1]|uniref:polysaccharide deacetylase family protein n=1 Tax=Methylobacterium sp. R2-1 TaxID=2587064 RepID=UPI00160779E0|nr:polysaccharide deacetylase family protein [Methylobacterium sp. R2-1]MBB2963017.1 peptidoglycan/xylan/chitin deacetylase (PgdA/CDA1 family) [Methylobacterium sp. R2-1]
MKHSVKTTLRRVPALRALALRGGALFKSLARAEAGLYTLCYHQVPEDQQDHFAAQLRHLGRHGDFIDADGAIERLAAGWPTGERAFLITFDDGYADTFEVARPVLKALGIPGIVFLVSDWIDAPPDTPPGLDRATSLSPSGRLYMNRAEVAAWCADGLDIGSHTATHRRLSRLGRTVVADEIARSRRDLAALIGREIRHFACPWGVARHDFDPELDPALALESGYQTFFTTRRGRALSAADFPAMPRHVVEPHWPVSDFEALMGGRKTSWRAKGAARGTAIGTA